MAESFLGGNSSMEDIKKLRSRQRGGGRCASEAACVPWQ